MLELSGHLNFEHVEDVLTENVNRLDAEDDLRAEEEGVLLLLLFKAYEEAGDAQAE